MEPTITNAALHCTALCTFHCTAASHNRRPPPLSETPSTLPKFVLLFFLFLVTLQAYLIGMVASICIGRESWCLPYAGFFVRTWDCPKSSNIVLFLPDWLWTTAIGLPNWQGQIQTARHREQSQICSCRQCGKKEQTLWNRTRQGITHLDIWKHKTRHNTLEHTKNPRQGKTHLNIQEH